MVTSVAVVYVSKHWQLATFAETAFVIAKVKEDTLGILLLTRLHKDVKFYPDISFADNKQHMTVAPLTPPGEDGLELCRITEDFAASALHQQPERYSKKEGLESWVPPTFQKAPAGKLQVISGSSCRAWGAKGSGPERHEVRVAGINTFASLPTNENGKLILPDYAFALCLPSEWPFHHFMNTGILPEKHVQGSKASTERNLQGDPVTTGPCEAPATSTKKHRKHKGKARPETSQRVPELPAVPWRPVPIIPAGLSVPRWIWYRKI